MLFEHILKDLAAKLVPQILPNVLRNLADQLERGDISFGQEEVAAMMETPEFKAVIASCEMPE